MLPEFGLRFPYSPTDFTQVNPAINRVLVGRALACSTRDRASASPTCSAGSGNFTPADRPPRCDGGRHRRQRRAGAARRRQRRCATAWPSGPRFRVANLFDATPESLEALGPFDKLLIDPPREGAIALVKSLPGDGAPRRIVYVSCSPATLARDAAVLVHDHGYALAAAGVVNMFPHTSHVESIALFDRDWRRHQRSARCGATARGGPEAAVNGVPHAASRLRHSPSR